jgi:predicted O-linked N-acetylglucosamine transferase (SPINDLY family)
MNELNNALSLHRQGKLNEAEKIYLNLLKKESNNAVLLQLIGTLYYQIEKYEFAESYLLKSLNKDPINPSTLNNLGLLYKKIDNTEESIKYFDKNIKKNNFLNSWVNKSNILLENKNYNEGLKFSKEALIEFPENIKLRNNLAIFYFECGYLNESLNIYQDFDKHGLHFIDSYFNYSNILIKINNLKEALIILNKMLFVDPKNQYALRQRAYIFQEFLDFDKAESDLLLAIQFDELNFLNNKTIVEFYTDNRKYQKAIPYCDLMIDKNIEVNFFRAKKIFCKIHLGSWSGLKNELNILNDILSPNNLSLNPLTLKYLSDDSVFQKKFTENYWDQRPKNNSLFNILKENNDEKFTTKIRVGYFSGDFTNHAVFQCIQDLFLNHDKTNFEIYAYSTFKKEGPERNKIKKNVDKFYDIDNLTDEEIVKLVISHSLDVSIDLSGYTNNNKSHLFEYNISKIKINYLGFPGTMGTKKYDYVIADQNIIPEGSLSSYSEKVLYMPEVYMPFSPQVFDLNINRDEFNLPKNAFIIGCFSRIEKILPNVFDTWMKVLNTYKDVYLALRINSEAVINNIHLHCKENNFNFNQILFLKPVEEHKDNLRRISTFNLYLDTYPYNGHSAISDSLFQCCVPTISFTGNSFASRVSYSFLKSLKLDQLITYNENEYLKKIQYYCENRKDLAEIRNYLIKHKDNNMNRMKKFTKDFELLILSIMSKEKNKF